MKEIYASAGVNRTPRCLSWRGDLCVYGSCNSIILVQINSKGESRIISTLCRAHSSRVNCVSWIDDDSFLSASNDSTIIIWRKKTDSGFEIWNVLKGHSKAVTSADSLKFNEDKLIISSASGDGTIKIWEISEKEVQLNQTLEVKGYALDLKLGNLPGSEIPVLIYSHDDGKVYIHPYSTTEKRFSSIPVHKLTGHEDWIQGLDLTSDKNGDLLLATCSQDSMIRVWRISPRSNNEVNTKPFKDLTINEDIRIREDVISITDDNFFAVSLETILCGHEDRVYQVSWCHSPRIASSSDIIMLLSCSFDKTMVIWSAPMESDVWVESMRVGEVGGNTLGFLGCQFGYDGTQILGYGFNGALHLWVKSDDKWEPGVTVGGHYASVEDLDWESNGRYLVSVSVDQTTRIHGPWKKDDGTIDWHEIGRPQVHGYDLSCIAMLPNHRFVSGAEEKVVRVFEATKNFAENYEKISGTTIGDEVEGLKKAQGASVPSLGLSNKAVYEDESEIPSEERHVKDIYPDHYFRNESYSKPPPEETLVQNTLWPELQKLYGHGYEIFRLATNPKGTLVASACKASKAEHADIILWDTETWSQILRLRGHALTVTAITFSPCGNFLLTGSRDRTWSLYEKKGENDFESVVFTDKKTSPHERLIWACAWSHDSKYFVTCSRDKKIALWNPSNDKPKLIKLWSNLHSSVTAVAFGPDFKDKSYYLISVGFEDGDVALLRFNPDNYDDDFDYIRYPVHDKTVKKLKFNRNFLLASCSADHCIKIFDLK